MKGTAVADTTDTDKVERVMREWSSAAGRARLTPHQVMVMAAQFAGLAAVDCCGRTFEGLEIQLQGATSAMNTAAVGRVQVRLGNAVSVRDAARS